MYCRINVKVDAVRHEPRVFHEDRHIIFELML